VRERAVHDNQIQLDQAADTDTDADAEVDDLDLDEEESEPEYQTERSVQWLKKLDD
jgi:23S rRNA (adenine2503-C2)-methyltransferase